jgi:hypothetical protein
MRRLSLDNQKHNSDGTACEIVEDYERRVKLYERFLMSR